MCSSIAYGNHPCSNAQQLQDGAKAPPRKHCTAVIQCHSMPWPSFIMMRPSCSSLGQGHDKSQCCSAPVVTVPKGCGHDGQHAQLHLVGGERASLVAEHILHHAQILHNVAVACPRSLTFWPLPHVRVESYIHRALHNRRILLSLFCLIASAVRDGVHRALRTASRPTSNSKQSHLPDTAECQPCSSVGAIR